jgi:hypothetical protein
MLDVVLASPKSESCHDAHAEHAPATARRRVAPACPTADADDEFDFHDPFGHGGCLDEDPTPRPLPDTAPSESSVAPSVRPSCLSVADVDCTSGPAALSSRPVWGAPPLKRLRQKTTQWKRSSSDTALPPPGPVGAKEARLEGFRQRPPSPPAPAKRARVGSPAPRSDLVQLGCSLLHASHTLIYAWGFCVCLRRFAYGSEAPRRLVAPCVGRASSPSAYAREMLGRLSSGRTPVRAVSGRGLTSPPSGDSCARPQWTPRPLRSGPTRALPII